MKIPAYLCKGDTIAITCPSGYLDKEKTIDAVRTLESWGLNVVVGKTVGSDSVNYFSESDAVRLSELQGYMDDTGIDAILMGRGGYGMSRIIDDLDFAAFKKRPKWVLGFSDISLLHSHLQQKLKIASIHSSMCTGFSPKEDFEIGIVTDSIKNALFGKKKTHIKAAPNVHNKLGTATGALVGGNLAMISHSIGSVSQLDTQGKILVLEDIGEHLYKIDRMLLQLDRAGMLKGLAGFVCGQFSDNEDTTRPFGASLESILMAHVSKYDYPVALHFPIGHEDNNMAIKLGVEHALKVDGKGASLKEL